MTTAAPADLETGVTLGSTGQRARWTLSQWGGVTPWGQVHPVTLDWYVAAEDRWHVPAQEPTVRQERIEEKKQIAENKRARRARQRLLDRRRAQAQR